MIGSSIGSYEILDALGSGGMGDVYRARDTKLNRDVALKFLPDELVSDKSLLARFDREAKLLATLNHPNIATIHSIEEHEGKPFLVLELVEGESVSDRLLKGPFLVRETLEICRQVASGLEAAHKKGIVHRDLKPANVMVTAGGGWRIREYHWCEFRMGAVASTIFLMNMAAFHMFIGFLFAWRAGCRMRRRIV